jgi:hypothetical protein
LLHSALLGQWRREAARDPDTVVVLTGNLARDLSSLDGSVGEKRDTVASVADRRKSGLQAAAFSMILPGAGEFYAESYWKAAAFLAAEVGLWVAYAIYDGKGDRQTALFEQYADRFWDVVKYAQWIEEYGKRLNPDARDEVLQNLYNRADINLPPWKRVYWDRLNAAEAEIGRRTGTYFSHQLPRRPEQQYYELIGKYPQYNPGWKDANVDNTNFHAKLTQRFLEYSAMRGKANDLYAIAGTAAKLIVLNHVLSAFDAAWTASRYNRRLELEAHIAPVPRPFGIVEFVPTAQLRLTF